MAIVIEVQQLDHDQRIIGAKELLDRDKTAVTIKRPGKRIGSRKSELASYQGEACKRREYKHCLVTARIMQLRTLDPLADRPIMARVLQMGDLRCRWTGNLNI